MVASGKGHLDCLKYAHEHGCPWDNATCIIAADNGQLECLQYAHENGCPWDENICIHAAKYGHIYCLKYAYENGCTWVDEKICKTAKDNNQLDCLLFALEKRKSDCLLDDNKLNSKKKKT
jgi:hypothetical protein